MQPRHARTTTLATLALTLVGAAWPGGGRAQEREPELPPPLTLSFAANAVMPSVGIDLSAQVLDRLAVGAQVTTLVVHYDASLRTRLYLSAGRRGGPYLGVNLHLWYSPLILSRATGAVTGEVGWEWRTDHGLVVGLGLGAGRIRIPAGSQGSASEPHWEVLPMANLRIGRRW